MTETVSAAFDEAARRFGERPAFAERTDAGWTATSWSHYGALVTRAAAGMIALGAAPAAGVAVLSANRPEWAIANFAAIAAGAIPTGLYATSTNEQCRYQIGHCAARVAVVDTPETLARLLAVRDELPELRALILIEGESDAPGVVGWRQLLERGGEIGEAAVRERERAQRPEDVATLIYTSGTTGMPKGVELTHRNLVWTARTAVRHDLRLGAAERQLCYLPLSHIAEQMIALHLPLQHGGCVHYVGALEQLGDALREVRPTLFFGVPRVWEKLQTAVEGALEGTSTFRRRMARWAMRHGREAGYAIQRGGAPSLGGRFADRLVLAKMRARLGLDAAAYCASAAAPISRATLEFFLALGIPIQEIYGLSETSGPGTVSRSWNYRTGRVGTPMTGVEVRVDDEGEVLMRGPNIFRGYRADPEGTAAVLEPDGWFHSGDLGAFDDEGFLYITGRKKELLVTSGGKKVAPAPIENLLREIPGIAQAVLVGERRNYIAALLTLDPALLPELANRLGSAARTLAEASDCPRLRAFYEREIGRVNRALARFESVRRFRLLDAEFTIGGGELTPTLKLKRRMVYQKYAQAIESSTPSSEGRRRPGSPADRCRPRPSRPRRAASDPPARPAPGRAAPRSRRAAPTPPCRPARRPADSRLSG